MKIKIQWNLYVSVYTNWNEKNQRLTISSAGQDREQPECSNIAVGNAKWHKFETV